MALISADPRCQKPSLRVAWSSPPCLRGTADVDLGPPAARTLLLSDTPPRDRLERSVPPPRFREIA